MKATVRTFVAAATLALGFGIANANAATVYEGDLGVLDGSAVTNFEVNKVTSTAETAYTWTFSVSGDSPDNYLSLISVPLAKNLAEFSSITLEVLSGGTLLSGATATATQTTGAEFLTVYAANLAAGVEYTIEVIATATKIGNSFAGNISVSPVPIPGAVVLFGSGLLGLVGFARRRRNISASVTA